VATTANRYQSQ